MSNQLTLFDQTGSNSYGIIGDENLSNKFNQKYSPPEVQLIFDPPSYMKSRPKMSSSNDVEKVFRENWPKGKLGLQEHFYMMMLNRNNVMIGVSQVGIGGISFAPIDLRIVFGTAIKACSSVLIFAHNHPSGNLTPSQADIAITKKLMAGAQLLDMDVVDHLILTPWEYYSMADEGVLPKVGKLERCIEVLKVN